MNLEARKLTFIEKFISLNNDEIISQFEELLAKVKNNYPSDGIKPMTVHEFNERIDKSMKDSIEGKLTDHEDLKKESEKWT